MTKDEAWNQIGKLHDEYLEEEKKWIEKLKAEGKYQPCLDGPKSEIWLKFERKAYAIFAQIYNIRLTDEELQIFKQHIQLAKNELPGLYKSNVEYIAYALCWVGSHRGSRPTCERQASKIMDRVTDEVHRYFTEEEMESIVLACMDDEHNTETIRSVLPEGIAEKIINLCTRFNE